MLGEFGDDPRRYADGKARKNYGGTSPITRAPGRKKTVAARYIRNDRLIDALMLWAFASLNASPGAGAFYDAQLAKGLGHNDALRRLANGLTGILHGCLKAPTRYHEATAWSHREELKPAASHSSSWMSSGTGHGTRRPRRPGRRRSGLTSDLEMPVLAPSALTRSSTLQV